MRDLTCKKKTFLMATSVSPPLHLPLVTSRTQSRSRSACNVQSTFLSSTSDRFYQVRRPVLKLDRIRSKVSASSTQVLEKPSSTTISRASDVNLGDPSYPFGFGAFDQQDLLPRNPSWLANAIKSSCENKPEVLSLNESNCQMMANLNLSHTFSQVIQEDMSQGVGLIDKSLVTRTGDILQNTELPTALPGSMTKDTSEPFIVVMAVPKKRTSRTKSKIRKNVWKAKGKVAAKKALSLAKSIATGRSKSFVVSK